MNDLLAVLLAAVLCACIALWPAPVLVGATYCAGLVLAANAMRGEWWR